jgi:hypothetical protein
MTMMRSLAALLPLPSTNLPATSLIVAETVSVGWCGSESMSSAPTRRPTHSAKRRPIANVYTFWLVLSIADYYNGDPDA